jgi:hypothetical protein
MRNRKTEQQAVEQLDRYIDQPDAADDAVSHETRRVVDALQRAATNTRPHPGFVNELAQELSAREKSMPEPSQSHSRPLVLRLLAGGATLVAAVALLVVIAGLFARRADEPALEDVEITPPNQVDFISNAEGGFLAGVEVQVLDAPSTAPEQLTAYTFQPLAQPQTPEEARTIAARFGLDDVRIYRPSLGSGLTAFAADGRTLTLADSPVSVGFYYSDPTVAAEAGEALPFDAAAAAAEAFLQPIGFLPAAYELQPAEEANRNGVTGVRVVPLLDGHPVIGSESQVSVNGNGEVTGAYVVPFDAAPTDETIDAGSGRDALQSLLSGPEVYSYSYNAVSTEGTPLVFTPAPPAGQNGDTVTVTGWPVIYTDVESGEQLVQLSSGGGVQYFVEGLALEGSDADRGAGLAVTGTLGKQLGPRSWRLSAQEFEQYNAQIECRTGSLERRTDGAYLVLDDGGARYPVPDAPAELENGARIELCAERFEPDEALSWIHIASPPSTEAVMSGGGGSGRSVTAVQIEPTITAPDTPAPAGPGATGEAYPPGVEVVEEVAVMIPPVVPEVVDLPYAPGEDVTITGRVTGGIWLEDEARRHDIYLSVDADDDLTTYPVALKLQGEPELLEEIARHYYLHVAVSGTIVEGDTGGQALQVDSFERVWPEEEVQAFLGHKRVETVEGREVTAFTDEATSERYIVDLHAGPMTLEDEERRILVTGAVHPEATFGGLPVLDVLGERSGDPVDQMQSADELPVERSMPVHEAGGPTLGSEFGDTLIVERIVLGYEAVRLGTSEQYRLTPAWLFYGRNAEGTIRFTLQLPLDSRAEETSQPDSTHLVPTRVQNGQSYPAP